MYNIKLNSFSFSDYSNIIINEIDGLCPPGSTITTQKMGKDGTQFQGSTKNERNIVINFSIINNVKETRKTMYKELVIGEQVNIIIDEYKTIGYIETFELNNFKSLTEGQISIICPSSYFYGVEQILRITQSGKTLESDMENDYIIQVSFSSSGTFFTYSLNGNDYTINYNFSNGDNLIIDTLNRKIYINNKNKYSTKNWIKWGLIKKGSNSFSYNTDTSCVPIVEYKNRYLGI